MEWWDLWVEGYETSACRSMKWKLASAGWVERLRCLVMELVIPIYWWRRSPGGTGVFGRQCSYRLLGSNQYTNVAHLRSSVAHTVWLIIPNLNPPTWSTPQAASAPVFFTFPRPRDCIIVREVINRLPLHLYIFIALISAGVILTMNGTAE